MDSCCGNNFIILFPCTCKARRERNPVQGMECLRTPFRQSPVRTRDLCMENTPIQAPSQGLLRAQSSTAFRNYFTDDFHRETISYPRAIIANNYEISGHSEQLRPGRTPCPQCLCVQWLNVFPETHVTQRPQGNAERQLQHMDFCACKHLTVAYNFCARKHKMNTKLESTVLLAPHPSNH